MKNWKDFVGFQEIDINKSSKGLECAYLMYRTNWKGELSLSKASDVVPLADFVYDKDTIGDIVEHEIRTSFPLATDKFDKESIVTNITTRRGKPNTNFQNVWYYRGEIVPDVDCPLFVVRFSDRYAIWKHPLYASYGFKLPDGC